MCITHTQYDLAVIGAGPAGASAAITAARGGLRVLLLDSDSFPREKVCGEFVSAESLSILRKLFRFTPDAGIVMRNAPQIEQARILFAGREIQFPLRPAGLSLSRYELDALLWKAAAQSGVQACSPCEVRQVEGEGPFRLATKLGEVSSNALIIATGRWSRFTPRAPILNGARWIGVKQHFYESASPASSDLYFFDHGYCGVQPVGEGIVNVCAMVRSDRATSLAEVFALDSALAKRAGGWIGKSQPVSTAPLIYRTPQPVAGNLMFAGDAAAFMDPFAGDGISIALRTGQLSAGCLLARREDRLHSVVTEYDRQYHNRFLPAIVAASRIRAMFSWPRPIQKVVFELLRTPGALPYFTRRTRDSG
jgi:flavin-dependent dehydrogenase